jgi:spermidine synthase
VGQALLLREVLVLFAGFELAAGLALASWLLWSAVGSWLAGRFWKRPVGGGLLAAGLSLLGLALPLTLVLARCGRAALGLAPGTAPGLEGLLLAPFLLPAPLCLVSGALFPLAWRAAGEGGGAAGRVYLFEAVGAALAGLLLYFILLPHCSALSVSLIAGFLALAGASLAVGLDRAGWGGWLSVLSAGALLGLSAVFAPGLDRATLAVQWGPDLCLVRDTPYQNLALLARRGPDRAVVQRTLFANGAWAFSAPDPQSVEWAVHPALLALPGPRSALFIGGDGPALAREALRHPGLSRVDCVDLDPGVQALWREGCGAPGPEEAAPDPRVRIIHADPARFLRAGGEAYDLILLHPGDPQNAGMNRLFTLEFFQAARERLAPGGVFSFAVPSAPEAVGPVEARALRTHDATLRAAFGEVLALPGDQVRFLASPAPGAASGDPDVLVRRMEERGLALVHVRDSYLYDQLNPLRRASLEALLDGPERGAPREADHGPSQDVRSPQPRLNRDFDPASAFNSLLAATLQSGGALRPLVAGLSAADPGRALFAAGILALALALCPLPGGRGGRRAVVLSVATAGALVMGLEIALLLAAQVLAGALYGLLCLVVAACMAGLAAGAWIAERFVRRPGLAGLMLVQGLLCLGAVLALPLFQALRGCAWPPGPVFGGLGLGLGLLGGLHFALAARIRPAAEPGTAKPWTSQAGTLWAMDLAGAALGSLAVSVLLPLFGMATALGALALIGAGGVAGLGLEATRRDPRPSEN